MLKPKISLIAAIAENRGLGLNNKLLFHLPPDMKRFQKLTLGHPVIMGRVTFESIGKPLPRRTNIIITRDKNYQIPGCFITHSLEEAIKLAAKKEREEIFIIGGGQIYTQALPLADKLYLTIVKGKFEADTFFPDYSQFIKVIYRQEGQYKDYQYSFLELVKKGRITSKVNPY